MQLNDVSHLLALKASMNMNDYQFGNDIIKSYLDYNNKPYSIQLLTTIIDFYGKCKNTESAENVFISIPTKNRDIQCIGAILTAYNNNKQYDKMISLYKECYDLIKSCSMYYNEIIYLLIIKACTNNGDFEFGQKIISKEIDYNNNTYSSQLITVLIDFYGKCKDIQSAQNVFESMAATNKKIPIQCIGALMTAFINNGYYENALYLYRDSSKWTLKDDTMHLLAIKAAMNLNDFQCGEQIINSLNIDIDDIATLYYKRSLLINTMMDFYGEMGDIENALKIFNNIPMEKRDIVGITIMMNAFCENGMNEECIQLFKSIAMLRDNEIIGINEINATKPNDIMFAVLLKACIHEKGFINFGIQIHEYLKQNEDYKQILKNIDVQISVFEMFLL